MGNLGEDIRLQREAKNMTIEELSEKTKISVAVLRDIENGKFDRYKGDEAYVKMYLKKISNVLSMDVESLTEQYVELTREIELEELQERVENENRQEKLVKKGKKFSFEAPELARKPSVYEDKSHVTIIRAAIILILVCLVIAVIWFGFYATRSKTKDPTFVQPSQPTVEGEVPTEEQSNQEEPNTQDQTSSTDIQMTRNDQLDFSFRLPENSETFVFKIEFGQKSWAQLTVNGQNYADFEQRIYHNSDSEEPEVIELTFRVEDFNDLVLKNGYSMGHRYYINNQEIPLTDEDMSNGITNLHLTLEKE